MRELPPMNLYQQLLWTALSLVHEEDLVAIARAAREHPTCNLAMRLLNEDLDRGLRLWDAFDEGGATHELFTWDMPELRVFLHGPGIIGLEFGTHGPPGDIVVWHAHMARTGVVERLICEGRLLEGDKPERDYEPGFNLPWGQA